MTVQQLYRDPNNWCQHALLNRFGQCCLVGALIECYGDHTPEMISAKRKVERVIASRGYPYSIEAYNDSRNRTLQDIINVVQLANV